MSLLMKALKKAEQKQGASLNLESTSNREPQGKLSLEPLPGASQTDHSINAGSAIIPDTLPHHKAANLFQAKQRGNKPWLIIAAVAGALVLTGWGVYFYLQISSPPPLTFPMHAPVATPMPATAEAGRETEVAIGDAAAPTEDSGESSGSNVGPFPADIAEKQQPHEKRTNPDTARREREDEGIKVMRESGSASINPVLASAYQAMQKGQMAIAQSQYQQLLTAEPTNIDAMLGLAAIAAKQGKADQAAKHYMRVLELDPRNAPAQAALIGFVGRSDPVSSEARLKQLIENQPSSFLFVALGNLYAEQAKWAAAEQAYFQAHGMTPGNPDYAFNLAVSLEHLNQPKQALSYYQQALQLMQASGGADFDKNVLLSRINHLSMAQGPKDAK